MVFGGGSGCVAVYCVLCRGWYWFYEQLGFDSEGYLGVKLILAILAYFWVTKVPFSYFKPF